MNKNLTIRLKSGFIINLENVSPESYGYLLKWLNKKWPELHFNVIDHHNKSVTITSPDNVDFIIERVVPLNHEP